MPANFSSLVTLTVVVMDSNATISTNLSSDFQGSTGLTVTYGIMSNCDANTLLSANGMAGGTPKVILTYLQPNLTYIYCYQGTLSFKVIGMFHSRESAANNPSWIIAAIIIAVVLSSAIGIIVGILLTGILQGIRQSKSIDNPI